MSFRVYGLALPVERHFPRGDTRPGREGGGCFGFDLEVAGAGTTHLGYKLGDGNEDERKGGRDKEDWKLFLKLQKGGHCYMAALVGGDTDHLQLISKLLTVND